MCSLSVRVLVAESLIKGAGQGLFAKAAAEPGTVMAFYNGVRITHSEVWRAASMETKIRWNHVMRGN